METSDYSLVNNELNELINQNSKEPVSFLYDRYNINPKSKRCKQSLITALIAESDKNELKAFVQQKNVWLKTVKLVRGGQVEASLSLPSFRFDEIVNESWEDSKLRELLLNTTFVLVFFDEESYARKKNMYIKCGLIWKMPENILDNGVRHCWESVVNNLREGKIVKYIGEDGRHHTFFPRTSDGPYVHVRPHAATSDSTLPLPVPDKLTKLTEYPMHSFWLTRSYIQKLLCQGDKA